MNPVVQRMTVKSEGFVGGIGEIRPKLALCGFECMAQFSAQESLTRSVDPAADSSPSRRTFDGLFDFCEE